MLHALSQNCQSTMISSGGLHQQIFSQASAWGVVQGKAAADGLSFHLKLSMLWLRPKETGGLLRTTRQFDDGRLHTVCDILSRGRTKWNRRYRRHTGFNLDLPRPMPNLVADPI